MAEDQIVEERLAHILARIPDEWIRTVAVYEGWWGIVEECDRRLAEIDPEYQVLQIKEKFGGLRYYFWTETDLVAEMNVVVGEAMGIAERTCEMCGGPGCLRRTPDGWYDTACDEHAREGAEVVA